MPDHARKRCRTCGEVKPAGEFNRDHSKRDGYRNSCRTCDRERDRRRYPARRDAMLAYQREYYELNGPALRDYQRNYRAANPEKIAARDRRYYEANREQRLEQHRQWEIANRDKVNESQRQRMARFRDTVFGHYGRVCACPGCYSTDSLGIDHINGDGRRHREELFGNYRRAGANQFYSWLIRNNFPGGYQTLCTRCNTSKGTGERCHLDHDLEYDVENDAW